MVRACISWATDVRLIVVILERHLFDGVGAAMRPRTLPLFARASLAFFVRLDWAWIFCVGGSSGGVGWVKDATIGHRRRPGSREVGWRRAAANRAISQGVEARGDIVSALRAPTCLICSMISYLAASLPKWCARLQHRVLSGCVMVFRRGWQYGGRRVGWRATLCERWPWSVWFRLLRWRSGGSNVVSPSCARGFMRAWHSMGK